MGGANTRGVARIVIVSVWLATLGMGLATAWVAFMTDFLDVAAAAGAAAAGARSPTADFVTTVRVAMVAICLVTVAYASVGALLAVRRGGGRIGGILLAGGALFALVPFGYMVGGYMTNSEPQSTLYAVLLLIGPVAVGAGYTAILPAVAIAFPDGGLPSQRWRLPVTVALGVIGFGTIAQLVRPGSVAGPGPGPSNPFGIDLLPAWLGNLSDVGTALALLAMTGLGVAAVVTRYRRGSDVERQQQRWFLAAVWLAAIPLALSFVPGIGAPTMLAVAGFGLFLVPVAVGIAVARYRLYEIDHLISRTLVYVPLTALLAGLYAGTVALLQRVFQAATGDTSDAAIIISTLILASVFTPIRKWLEGIVDRRFKPGSAVSPAGAVSPADHREDPNTGDPDWDARMTAVALRVVRAEFEARAATEAVVDATGEVAHRRRQVPVRSGAKSS